MSEEAQVKSYKVMPSDFSEARFTTNRWAITAKAGTPYEAILNDSAYWAHNAHKLKPCDMIDVHAQDRSFYAELYVVTVGNKSAVVRELKFVKLEAAPIAAVPFDFEVEWAGPHHKWRVVRKSDKAVIEKGFDTEAKAAAYAALTNKNLAA